MMEPQRAEIEPVQMRVQNVVHLIPAVEFGSITIRFEHGHPTLVERHENIRLPGARQERSR